jgi:hypothetical protein
MMNLWPSTVNSVSMIPITRISIKKIKDHSDDNRERTSGLDTGAEDVLVGGLVVGSCDAENVVEVVLGRVVELVLRATVISYVLH